MSKRFVQMSKGIGAARAMGGKAWNSTGIQQIASSAVIHWNGKCETAESEKIYGGINMAVFIVMLLGGGAMFRYS